MRPLACASMPSTAPYETYHCSRPDDYETTGQRLSRWKHEGRSQARIVSSVDSIGGFLTAVEQRRIEGETSEEAKSCRAARSKPCGWWAKNSTNHSVFGTRRMTCAHKRQPFDSHAVSADRPTLRLTSRDWLGGPRGNGRAGLLMAGMRCL